VEAKINNVSGGIMKQTLLFCLLLVLTAGLMSFTGYASSVDEFYTDGPSQSCDAEGLRSVPVSPENLSIILLNATDVRVTWQPVTQASNGLPFIPDGYKVFCTTDPTLTPHNSTFLGSTVDTQFDHLGVIPAHECMFYSVLAYKESMILVQGGTFNNGASDVTLSSFYLDKYEITQDTYLAVMGVNPSHFSGLIDGPTERVSWLNTIEYCNRRSILEGLNPCYEYGTYGSNPDNWPANWYVVSDNPNNVICNWTANGYRLPTEMEWMFAAMGGILSQGTVYSGGSDVDAVAWWLGNSGETSHQVGGLAPNQLGIYDMSGNVWEWCWDIYASYPVTPQNDPHGPISGSYRIARGGSWGSAAMNCAIAHRNYYAVNTYHFHIGFRVCRIPNDSR